MRRVDAEQQLLWGAPLLYIRNVREAFLCVDAWGTILLHKLETDHKEKCYV